MTTPESSRSGGEDATTTPRTIEDIERRAAEVLEQERQALAALVACVREVAVRLPVESRLPLDLAMTATTLERWTSPSSRHAGMGVDCAFGISGLVGAIDTYMPRAGEDEKCPS